jgi:hypothetical protein
MLLMWQVVHSKAGFIIIIRVDQSHIYTLYVGLAITACIYTPYMTVYLVILLPTILYIHRIYGSGQPLLNVTVSRLKGNNPPKILYTSIHLNTYTPYIYVCMYVFGTP